MNIYKSILNIIVSVIGLISSAITILSFFGYSSNNIDATYIIIILVLSLIILIFINYTNLLGFLRKIIKKFKIDYSSIQRDNELVSSLIPTINNKKGNGVFANIITYSYKITENRCLNICVDIDGIKELNDKFSVCLLGSDKDNSINITCNKNNIAPYSTHRENNYTIYKFNLPHSQKNIKIKINQEISLNKHTNLYFAPYNYVSEVDIIKIKTNKKRISCYEIKNHKYQLSNSIFTNNNIIQLDGNKHIKSIFKINDYKH